MAFETYGYGGILVERGRIDRSVAQTAFDELASAQSLFPGIKNEEVTAIDQYSSKVSSIRMFPSVATVLNELEVTDGDASINVNYQPPNAEQKFHRDNPVITFRAGMLAVVHLSDNGAFDFSMSAVMVDDARDNYERIMPLGAGDVVYQKYKIIPHRGVNLGNSMRITLGIPLAYSF
jgi:hypothetical protein